MRRRCIFAEQYDVSKVYLEGDGEVVRTRFAKGNSFACRFFYLTLQKILFRYITNKRSDRIHDYLNRSLRSLLAGIGFRTQLGRSDVFAENLNRLRTEARLDPKGEASGRYYLFLQGLCDIESIKNDEALAGASFSDMFRRYCEGKPTESAEFVFYSILFLEALNLLSLSEEPVGQDRIDFERRLLRIYAEQPNAQKVLPLLKSLVSCEAETEEDREFIAGFKLEVPEGFITAGEIDLCREDIERIFSRPPEDVLVMPWMKRDGNGRFIDSEEVTEEENIPFEQSGQQDGNEEKESDFLAGERSDQENLIPPAVSEARRELKDELGKKKFDLWSKFVHSQVATRNRYFDEIAGTTMYREFEEKASNTVKIDRCVSVSSIPEDHRKYTGVLNIVRTQTGSAFYNYYPLFIWENQQPKAIENDRLLEDFPDFGSVLLDGNRSNNRRLRDGMILNVTLNQYDLEEQIVSDKRRTVYSVNIDSLVKEGRLIEAEKDEEAYRAYYVCEAQNEDVHTEEPIVFAEENSEYQPLVQSVLLKCKGYNAVVSLRKNGQNQVLSNGPAETYPDILKVVKCYRGLNSLWIQSQNLNLPNLRNVCCQFAFTGPQLTESYWLDTLKIRDLYIEAVENIGVPPEYVTAIYQWAQSELSKTDTAGKELDPIRMNRMVEILRANMAGVDRIFANNLFSRALIGDWRLRHSKNQDELRNLLESILNTHDGFEIVLSHDKTAKELREVQRKLKARENELNNSIRSLESQNSKLISEQKKLAKSIGDLQEIADVDEEIRRIKAEKRQIEKEIDEVKDVLEKRRAEIEEFKDGIASYEKALESPRKKIAELLLDRTLSDGLGISAPASVVQAETTEADNACVAMSGSDESRKISVLASLPYEKAVGHDLVAHLVQSIQRSRHYSWNDIVNCLSAISQGYLTVFAGAPGSGKTSFCDILGNILGLGGLDSEPAVQKVWGDDAELANRYLSVAVERGWTSKRDFIGYFNPLSRTFECGDPHRFEFLKMMDAEARNGGSLFPYVVLLDEANLSPMEYYFADFMNVGDRRGGDSSVALGNQHHYRVTDALRFLATINSDHTTERLSPRLIDRAWVITLPDYIDDDFTKSEDDTIYAPVPWKYFKNTFDVNRICKLNNNEKRVLEDVYALLRELRVEVSFRSKKAVQEYINAASYWMMPETAVSSELQAMDYAVAQKLLPKIDVFGVGFDQKLRELKAVFEREGFAVSKRVVDRILERDGELNGYSYF